MTSAAPLPYGRQWIDDDDIAAVAAALRSDWLTTGPIVTGFEEAFADRVGAEHAVVCSSGTAALHLAALALGLGAGDAVIVPSMTFAATANAIRYVDAEVVFADVDPDTGLMGPADVLAALDRAEKLGLRVRAVFPVHLNGQVADLNAIAGIAERHRIHVVDDACHAIGSLYRSSEGRVLAVGAGRHSAMTVFSFHPVKNMTTGEGGMLTTNDGALARKLRRLRNHGIVREPVRFENRDLAYDDNRRPHPWYYELPELGFNYRASDIHCALGLSQLRKLDSMLLRRRELIARYEDALQPLAPAIRPVRRVADCVPAWHLCVVLIEGDRPGTDRTAVFHRLAARQIGTQVHYIPLHLQPYYRGRYGAQYLPGSIEYYRRCLSLPLFPAMADGDVIRVVDALAEIVTGRVAA